MIKNVISVFGKLLEKLLHTGILVPESTEHGLGGQLLTHGDIKKGEAGITVKVNKIIVECIIFYSNEKRLISYKTMILFNFHIF